MRPNYQNNRRIRGSYSHNNLTMRSSLVDASAVNRGPGTQDCGLACLAYRAVEALSVKGSNVASGCRICPWYNEYAGMWPGSGPKIREMMAN